MNLASKGISGRLLLYLTRETKSALLQIRTRREKQLLIIWQKNWRNKVNFFSILDELIKWRIVNNLVKSLPYCLTQWTLPAKDVTYRVTPFSWANFKVRQNNIICRSLHHFILKVTTKSAGWRVSLTHQFRTTLLTIVNLRAVNAEYYFAWRNKQRATALALQQTLRRCHFSLSWSNLLSWSLFFCPSWIVGGILNTDRFQRRWKHLLKHSLWLYMTTR